MTSTKFNISDAARVVGKSRATIQRALKAGTLSATLDAKGHKKIDASELVRCFGDEADFGRVMKAAEGAGRGELADLQASSKLEAMQNKLEAQYKAEIARLESALERSQEGHNRITLLLESKVSREEEWAASMAGLRKTAANKEEEVIKLRQALRAEREKTLWQKLFR